MDILKDQWAAAMTLRTVLLSIQALLAAPEPSDPQVGCDRQTDKQTDRQIKQTDRQWASIYLRCSGSASVTGKSICLSNYLAIYLSYLSNYLSINLSIYLGCSGSAAVPG